jgi:hypothetical protein
MKFKYYIKSESYNILSILKERWGIIERGIFMGDDAFYLGVDTLNKCRRKDIKYWECLIIKNNK